MYSFIKICIALYYSFPLPLFQQIENNIMEATKKIEFTRINNDVNGKPRYVCHFLSFITDKDREDAYKDTRHSFGLDNLYSIALQKARKFGGKKYHNKQYGGGIVFQSYNIADLEQRILNSL